jgi:acyl carrier protein
MSSLETIQRMMVEQFDLNPGALTPEAQLEGLGLDSLSVIEFMFNIEDEFKIKLPDERVEIKTIQDIATIVDRLVAEQQPSA